MRMLRTISLVALALGLLASAACGGSPKPLIPVDSPLVTWQPPEDQEAPAEKAPAPAPEAAKPAGKPQTK